MDENDIINENIEICNEEKSETKSIIITEDLAENVVSEYFEEK